MKNKLFILLFLSLIYGCQKKPFDYRNKFIGNYNFSVHKRTWSTLGPVTETDYNYTGTISYGNYNDNAINIIFLDDKNVEPILYEDGSLKFQALKGEFESTKKLHFLLGNYALGGGTTYEVSGEKIK